MRLSPIEKPASLTMRIAYRLTKRRFGKVITPLKVVYARMPKSLKSARAMSEFMHKGLRLDRGLVSMLSTYVASINGCGFCIDIGKSFAAYARVPMEKLRALPNYTTSPLFTERERAALAYVEEITRTRDASDETFERLKEHFSDDEIVEITWVNAVENYYNLINRPLRIESDGLCILAEQRLGPS
ncbi:MAG: putative transposase fusion protein [Candidatus Hydrogenedentota bacterium]